MSMDLRCPSRKKPAPSVGENIVSNVDRISELPDEVLCYILSFLTMKQAIRTSILSKRWEWLWTLTTSLDFSDDFRYKFAVSNSLFESSVRSFKDYVDRVLFYHGGTTIQRCRFQCIAENVASNLYSWVCAVIACNVEELTVETCFQEDAKDLPWRVFTCQTLVALELRGLFVVNLPTYISLPSLKTLSLTYVIYVDDALMQRLFSSCPALEDLNVTRTGWDGVETMNISVPSLKRLTLTSKMRYILGHRHKTVLNCPFLEYLEIHDASQDDCSANFSPSLVEAHISGSCTFGLFKGISQVKHLVLSAEALWSLKASLHDNELPTLYSLTKLELLVGKHIDWELLPQLLESSPNLEVLMFPQGLVVPKENGRDFRHFYWYKPDDVPECLLSHLKTIEINKFVGMPGEIYLVEYLLENSFVLDRMVIYSYDFAEMASTRKQLESIRDEVLRMARGSPACHLTFWM